MITSAEQRPDNIYKITADLTIKGITNKIVFAANVTVKRNNFLATANIIIDRTKWDVVYKSGNIFKDLGDKISCQLFSSKSQEGLKNLEQALANWLI